MRPAVAAFLLGMFLPAIVFGQSATAPRDVTQAEGAVRALVGWLEAEEPAEAHLAMLLKHRDSVVPSLIAALNSGPAPARRERLRRSLDSGYERLAEQARREGKAVAPSRDDYVRHYAYNFEALYRIRAAQALAAIGGAQARQALEASLKQSHRPDVREAIENALGTAR